eukprot:TRINITY_DN6601_c0_g1_i1.p1 TRINITY_DN6601_c0_g1~~TRINITY_DN6601_c0_g1_i1.p1  ORF type:complete len:252 (+),score=64.14 TRINITY_DN6601_c0_g1_i1:67-756(+)
MKTFERKNTPVLPGECVGVVDDGAIVKIGVGLMQEGNNITSTKAGVLRWKKPNTYWVETNQKKYVPALEDMVVGTIIDRRGEGFSVDIGYASSAQLPFLAFEGATRRNRPDLAVGSVVYARVVVCNKDMDPELVCVNQKQKADCFGELKDGYVFKCSIGLCAKLLSSSCLVLEYLGQALPYEIAVGRNGRVWVRAGTCTHTILIANAILNSEHLTKKTDEDDGRTRPRA